MNDIHPPRFSQHLLASCFLVLAACTGAPGDAARSGGQSLTAELVSGGIYELENACSGMVMDVAGADTSNGATVLQFPRNRQLNQQWKLEAASAGYFRLVSKSSGKVLDAANFGQSDGSVVFQWVANGGANQEWAFLDAGGGYARLSPHHAVNMALDLTGASTQALARVQLWTPNTSCAQKWKLNRLDAVTPSPTPPPTPSTPTPGNPPAPLVWAGPLTVTKGGTYTGNWASQDPAVPAVDIQTSEPVVIENSNLRSPRNLIHGFNVRLTVRGSRGEVVNSNVAGSGAGYFINLEDVYSLEADNNYSFGAGLVYVNHFHGDASVGETIRVLRNVVRNVDGRPSDGAGGYRSGSATTGVLHFVMFNNVHRVAGAEVAWNDVINEPGKTMLEDNVNMYVSSGTPNSPILIHDNYIQGAYNAHPATDPNYSGGGIILGDGTSTVPLDIGYAQVFDNQIVSTCNYGLSIVGGVEQSVYRNRVVASGRMADGTRIAAQNVGLVMWDINHVQSQSPSTYQNNHMTGNSVAWTRVMPDGSTQDNPWWMPDGADSINANTSLGSGTLAMEAAERQSFLGKAASSGVHLGP